MINLDRLDEETAPMIERLVVVRISTKYINLWIGKLQMKGKERCELAGLMELEGVQEEIAKAKDLEKWAKRCTQHFTKRVKKTLFQEVDNRVWSGAEKEVSLWCKKNKVYDEITEDEIQEILLMETPDDGESIRLNGKYVCETAKRVCVFINTHTPRTRPHHFVSRIQRSNVEGDKGHQRGPQYGAETKTDISQKEER